MAKDKLTDYSATNASNTDVGGVNTDEGMLPSAVNNAIREVMTHLKNFASGTDGIDVLSLADDTATNAMKIQAPSSVTTTTTLTLPDGDGTSGQALTTNGTGTLSWSTISGGIADVVDDTTPQLGGNLDLNSNNINGTGSINITGNANLSYAGVPLFVDATNSNTLKIALRDNGTTVGYLGANSSYPLFVGNSSGSAIVYSDGSGNLYATTVSAYQAVNYSIGAYNLGWINNTATNPSTTRSGSVIMYSNTSGSYRPSYFTYGTWRCMGGVASGSLGDEVTVWQRIS